MLMTKTSKKFGYTLAAISLSLLVFASTIATGWVINAANAQQVAPENDPIIQHVPLPLPVLTSVEEQALFEIAKNIPEVKAWTADGWQHVVIDFLGTENPAKWTHAIVHLKLPSTAAAKQYCSEGWQAVAKINLETMQVEDADYPSDTHAQCHGEPFGGPVKIRDTTTSVADFIIPQAFALSAHGIEAARQDDVTDLFVSYYGNQVSLKTPTIGSGIYANMDWWVGYSMNADFGTGKFLQAGWVVTTPEFPTGTGIGPNSKAIVYIDESTYGNLHPHNTYFAWVNGATLGVQQLGCQPGNFHAQYLYYNSQTYSHPTNVPCSTAVTKSNWDNSVWIENANTANKPATGWAPYITSSVAAVSAYETKSTPNSSAVKWSTSSNRKMSCTGFDYASTNVGNLANFGQVIWTNLVNTPNAC